MEFGSDTLALLGWVKEFLVRSNAWSAFTAALTVLMLVAGTVWLVSRFK